MEAKEKTKEEKSSSTSTSSAFVENSFYTVETTLGILRGEVTKITDMELVIAPFRFEQNSMVRYHNGLSEPFLKPMIIGRASIVHAKEWYPA